MAENGRRKRDDALALALAAANASRRQTLARESQIDPDLAEIVIAWRRLPEAIRWTILALIDSPVMVPPWKSRGLVRLPLTGGG
jgi:hypothetical protein